jgi:hypothetical protein
MLSEMEYPHWLMVAGGALVVFGFIGVVFHKNKISDTDEDNLRQPAPFDPIQAALEVQMKAKRK